MVTAFKSTVFWGGTPYSLIDN